MESNLLPLLDTEQDYGNSNMINLQADDQEDEDDTTTSTNSKPKFNLADYNKIMDKVRAGGMEELTDVCGYSTVNGYMCAIISLLEQQRGDFILIYY